MAKYDFLLGSQLTVSRCPHCSIAKPRLGRLWGPLENRAHSGANRRFWAVYQCDSCGGLVTAASTIATEGEVTELYPEPKQVSESIPESARTFLQQAIESMHAPAGAVMLAASAVDAMLKLKGYKKDSLYSRIDKAASDHLITDEMAAWAHEIRLDANEPRHADEAAPLPSEADAKKCVDFALALGEFLFVLPARVARGRKTGEPG